MSVETTRTRIVPAVLSVVGLFLLMIAAARFQGIPVFTPPDLFLPAKDGAVRPTMPPADTGIPDVPQSEPDPVLANILSTIAAVVGIAVAVAVGVGLLWVLVRAVMRLWSQRRLRRREGASLAAGQGGGGQEEVADAAVVRTGIGDALHDIEEHPDPGDAIIAAWMGLELSAERAGFVRAVAETPAEFTRRIIVRAAGAAADVDSLLRLYERVRFGGYAADENDRIRAREALRRIQEVRR